MSILVQSYAKGKWEKGDASPTPLFSANDGKQIAEFRTNGLDYKGMVEYARSTGGKNLRPMPVHERALRIKSLAQHLMSVKKEFYKHSVHTGATKADSWIDIDGGISSLFITASKARREMQNEPFYVDGPMEQLSRKGTFVGQHIYLPLNGVAVHINAFNFPVWGMLEKLGSTIIAGVPAIIKPSPVGSYLSYKVFEEIINTGLLPDGTVQFIAADKPGDLLDHLHSQDIVAFTGSAETGQKLKSHPNIIKNNVRFNLETDSINCAILGEDVTPDMPEFDLFIKEVRREMTAKTGQKCTAIRRAIVPESRVEDVKKALKAQLEKITIGDASDKNTRMGPLASKEQVERYYENIEKLKKDSQVVYEAEGESGEGAFCKPIVLFCKNPHDSDDAHHIEAFGPATTIMPYTDTSDAISLANKGDGSLVGSLFTWDDTIAKEIVLGVGAYHGRFMILNRNSAGESTGHGSPMPHLTHGGPGRAGGGEELGGIRGILRYMQRVALQGSPTTLTNITNEYLKGADIKEDKVHPFMKEFEELEIGETLYTHRRTITEADISNFAGLSGDHFYAHTDELAARRSLFEQRVAHGYFLISAAAGMFVHPAEGPVLANYGMDDLRFVKPVGIGDTIRVKFTCKRKTLKEMREEDEIPKGIVHWDVEIWNQHDEMVADYTILTMVRRQRGDNALFDLS